MDQVLRNLKIKDNQFTKTPKKQKVFNKVKNNIPPIENYNMEADILFLPTTKDGYKYLFVLNLLKIRQQTKPLKHLRK